MSEDIIISAKDLTKTYKLYNSHIDRVKETFHPFRRKYHHPFNALADVSFDVKKGETLGIIGRNGSGKSTLLQIICGILIPTSGRIEVKGKLSALLELGAGFNPEFSGRQNVYINGAILGLERDEIDLRFDDIAAFADIRDYIDQPVKSYSSGMVVRLAFAVAINIDPDILVVDEALSVGDEAFQRKCFARIKQIQERGGTILFVSHGSGTIVELCNRAILFDEGELLLCGSPQKVVSQYHKMIFAPPERVEELKNEWRKDPNRLKLVGDEVEDENKQETTKTNKSSIEKELNEELQQESFYDPGMVPQSTVYYEKNGAIIENPHVTTIKGKKVNIIVNRGEYIYTYSVYFDRPAFQVRFGMLIKTVSGLEIGGGVTAPLGKGIEYIREKTRYEVQFCFHCLLSPGVYFLNAGVLGIVNDSEVFLDRNIDIAMFRVQEKENLISTAICDFVKHSEISMVEKVTI